MRTECKASKPDLTLEDREKKTIFIVNMSCTNEVNKKQARAEKIKNTNNYALNYANDDQPLR